jgi:hypothetical protein
VLDPGSNHQSRQESESTNPDEHQLLITKDEHMNTQSIALAVITAALAGIGVAHVERLLRSAFDLLLVARNRSHIANRIFPG